MLYSCSNKSSSVCISLQVKVVSIVSMQNPEFESPSKCLTVRTLSSSQLLAKCQTSIHIGLKFLIPRVSIYRYHGFVLVAQSLQVHYCIVLVLEISNPSLHGAGGHQMPIMCYSVAEIAR